MPELPEVETTRRGIANHLIGCKVNKVVIHQPNLRWPVNKKKLRDSIEGKSFNNVVRRGKYLLFNNSSGWMICHLGMSGSLRIVTNEEPRRKHDHIEWILESKMVMRFHDPRRFGCVLWSDRDVYKHERLRDLGPEPLSDDFSGLYLYQQSRRRKLAVKAFIMNSRIVVGVGNIYASESLFVAGIHPLRSAARISKIRYEILTQAIRVILTNAIKSGGTTLRDFVNSDGEPGYFQQQLNVYNKQGVACIRCNTAIKKITQSQRATYYCPSCQF